MYARLRFASRSGCIWAEFVTAAVLRAQWKQRESIEHGGAFRCPKVRLPDVVLTFFEYFEIQG